MNANTRQITYETSAIQIENVRVHIGELLQKFHRRGFLKPALLKATEDTIVADYSELLGFVPPDAEVQQAADQFRRQKGLLSAQQTQEWLNARNLSEVDFEEIIVQQLQYAFVFSRVTETARQSFQSAPGLWDRWTYQELFVPSESLAQELRCQHLEEGVSLSDLADRHASVSSAGMRSDVRSCFRAMLPRWMFEFADGSTKGSVIGPLACPSGWALILVETVTPAVFDQATESAIRKHLFRRWLSARMQESKISYPLLDLLSCSND